MFSKKSPPPPAAAAGKGRKNEGKPGGDGGDGEGKDGEREGNRRPRVGESEKPLYEFTLSEPVEAGTASLPLDRPPGCEKGSYLPSRTPALSYISYIYTFSYTLSRYIFSIHLLLHTHNTCH